MHHAYRYIRDVWQELFACFRGSEHEFAPVGLLLAYVYFVVTSLLLVNMLIAMMSKTFDNVSETNKIHHTFLFARTVLSVESSPPAPLPLYLLSVPYEIARFIPMAVAAKKTQNVRRRPVNASSPEAGPVVPGNALSKLKRSVSRMALKKQEDRAVHTLAVQLRTYVAANEGEGARIDRWRTSLVKNMNARFKRLELRGASSQGELAALSGRVDSWQMSTDARLDRISEQHAEVLSLLALVSRQLDASGRLRAGGNSPLPTSSPTPTTGREDARSSHLAKSEWEPSVADDAVVIVPHGELGAAQLAVGLEAGAHSSSGPAALRPSDVALAVQGGPAGQQPTNGRQSANGQQPGQPRMLNRHEGIAALSSRLLWLG